MTTDKNDKSKWTGKAALTGAAIGSAAIAAALLYSSHRKGKVADKPTAEPPSGEAKANTDVD